MTISAQKKHALSSALALALLLPLQAAAATGYFLEIDGVEGESTKGNPDGIELLSWSWGGSSPDGKVTCALDVTITKNLDSTTDDLVNALDTLKSFSEAKLSMVTAVSNALETYHTILLTDVQVVAYDLSGAGDLPTESVSLRYRDAAGSYRPIVETAQGPVLGDPQFYSITPGKCD